jgi:two-component system, chemotaxis family, response regulator Rcp1
MESETQRLILVIDPDPEHVRVIEEALSDQGREFGLIAIATAPQALDFLHQRGAYTDAARPDLILLDLNLPQGTGREILAAIKADPHLHRIPTVILTLSNSEADVFDSYALQGNCYVVKSTDLNQLSDLVKRIKDFWLGIVTLPVD